MAKTFLMLFILVCGSAAVFGQQPASTPPPAPAPTPNTTRTPAPITMRGLPPSLSTMPPSFGSPIEADPMARRMMIVQKYAVPMYRKPSDKELRPLAPDSAILAQYSQLLRRDDSGVFKLVPDAGCAENTKVLNASEACMKYMFPGAGNSFSFRTGSHRVRQLADVTYVSGGLWMTGVLMHGIMVDLGDVPLEQVSAKTPAIGFLTDFRPVDDFQKALDVDKLYVRGVRKDGYLYRRNLPAVAGHTYAVRSVAYQGRVMRAVPGGDYNELDFDKRNDVLTAFRVEKVDTDGTITIVWTRLSSARSPKLKVPEKDRSDKFARSERPANDPLEDDK